MIKKPKNPTERLLKATITGSLKGVRAAIDAGAAVNTMDEDWGTPLFIACRGNHPRIARFLLSCPGINITKGFMSNWPQGVAGCVMPYSSQFNTTPLYAAMEAGNLSIARMLLKHPDKEKYLQPNRNWISTIRGTFNYLFEPARLEVLLDAAACNPGLLQITIATAIKEAISRYQVAPELANLLRRKNKSIQKLVRNAIAEHIGMLVRHNEPDVLKYTLDNVDYFFEIKELLPDLQIALRIAQQRNRRECMRLLGDVIFRQKP